MKKLFTALALLFVCLTAQAQFSVSGSPNGGVRYRGGYIFDSTLTIPVRDTLVFMPAAGERNKGRITVRPQDGRLYVFNGVKWEGYYGTGGGGGSFDTSGYGLATRLFVNNAIAAYIPVVSWPNVSGKPSAFPPSAHTHVAGDLLPSGATNGQVLKYNGTAWAPGTDNTGGGGGTDTTGLGLATRVQVAMAQAAAIAKADTNRTEVNFVTAFGGRGDSSTDNTAAFAAAMNLDASKYSLYIPKGVYRTHTVTYNAGLTIRGAGYTSTGTVIRSISAEPLFVAGTSATVIPVPGTIERIYFDGANVGTIGWDFIGVANFLFDRNSFYNFTDKGVRLRGSLIGGFSNCLFMYNATGIDMSNINITAYGNMPCNLVQLRGCVFDYNTVWGVHVVNQSNLIIDGGNFEHNGTSGQNTGDIYGDGWYEGVGLSVKNTYIEQTKGVASIFIGDNTTFQTYHTIDNVQSETQHSSTPVYDDIVFTSAVSSIYSQTLKITNSTFRQSNRGLESGGTGGYFGTIDIENCLIPHLENIASGTALKIQGYGQVSTNRGVKADNLFLSDRAGITAPAGGAAVYSQSGKLTGRNSSGSAFEISPVGNSANQVWVDANGSNTTGRVGSSVYAFSTMDAALDATAGANATTVIHVGIGTFASPTQTKLRSNLRIVGAKMPTANYAANSATFPFYSVTAPTKLIGGTIFQGEFFIPETVDNIQCSGFGVDVGPDFIAANPGASQQGFLIPQNITHPAQSTTPPRRGMVFENIAALCATPNQGHAFLIENCYQPVCNNIYTWGGFAGFVSKNIGGQFRGIHAWTENAALFSIVLKHNAYAWSDWTTLDGFEISGGAGLVIQNEDGTTGTAVGLRVVNGQIHNTVFGIKTMGADANGSFELGHITLANVSGSDLINMNKAWYCNIHDIITHLCPGTITITNAARASISRINCIGGTATSLAITGFPSVPAVVSGCIIDSWSLGSNVISAGDNLVVSISTTVLQ